MIVVRPAVQLIIDGQERPVKAFDFRCPDGMLSSAVNVTLADTVTDVDQDSVATFKLGYRNQDGSVSWSRLVRRGRVIRHSHEVQWLNDSRVISIVNPMADKWALSSLHPVKLYDPQRVSVTDEESLDYYAILNEDDEPIRTEFVPRVGLNLMQCLDYVIRQKLGFNSFVTNIPNYSVIQLVIPLDGSYYSALSSLYSFFDPLVHVDEDDVVFIIDPLAPLPNDLPVKRLAAKDYTVAEKEKPVKQVVNAVLLSYNVLDNSQNYVGPTTVRVIPSEISGGTLGHPDYHQTVINRTITELHNDITNTSRITGEIELRVVTQIYGYTTDGPSTLLSEEVQEDTYTPDFRLKLGHHRTVAKRLKLPGVNFGMIQDVIIEDNHTQWERSTWNPNEWIKVWSVTLTRGLVLADGPPEISGVPTPESFRTVNIFPLTVANKLKLVSDTDDGNQTVFMWDITSEIEYWRELGGGQVNVHISKKDCLTNIADINASINHIADVRSGEFDERHVVKTRMIVDQPSVDKYGLREPLKLSAGDVPYELALPVAKRKLARAGASPRKATVTMNAYDLRVRKGSIKKLKLRNDVHERMLVTGYSFVGEMDEGSQRMKVTQRLEGIILDA